MYLCQIYNLKLMRLYFFYSLIYLYSKPFVFVLLDS